MLDRILPIIVIVGYALTPVCMTGIKVMGALITPSSCCFLLAVLLSIVSRYESGRPLLPPQLLKKQAMIATMIYFGIGLLSGIFAADKVAYAKEIVQRTVIIWLPLLATVLAVRKTSHLTLMFLCYIPGATVLSIIAFKTARSAGFENPVYLLGLHKNMTAGLSGTLAIICIAYILTSRRKFLEIYNIKIPNKLVSIMLAPAGLLGILAAQGRAGLVEVLSATLIMFIAVRVKKRTVIATVVACVLAGAVLYKMMPHGAKEHFIDTKRHSANAVRVAIWTDMVTYFRKHPLEARGWGNPLIDEHGFYYYDVACVLLFDWMQMGPLGAVALVGMMITSVKCGLDNSKWIPPNSQEGFVNTAGVGIATGKFIHGILDTFWVGRGHVFHVWTAVGACLFVSLLIEQRRTQALVSSNEKAFVKLK